MGGKKPKSAFNPQISKQPVGSPSQGPYKQPTTGSVDPSSHYQKLPAWRFARAEMCDPFGWHAVDAATAAEIREKLGHFEGRTWADILVKDKINNHPIPVWKLCKDARDRLTKLNIFVEDLVSLRLAGKKRVFGVWEEGVLSILWWDPEHKIYPVALKHT